MLTLEPQLTTDVGWKVELSRRELPPGPMLLRSLQIIYVQRLVVRLSRARGGGLRM